MLLRRFSICWKRIRICWSTLVIQDRSPWRVFQCGNHDPEDLDLFISPKYLKPRSLPGSTHSLPRLVSTWVFVCFYNKAPMAVLNSFLSTWVTVRTMKLRHNCVMGSKIKVPTQCQFIPNSRVRLFKQTLTLNQLPLNILRFFHHPSLFLSLPRWNTILCKT